MIEIRDRQKFGSEPLKKLHHSCVGRNLFNWSASNIGIPTHAGMRILLVLVLLVTSLPTFAQPNLTNAEYFFDVDPGVGGGLPLSFTTGQTSLDITPSLTQGLAPGTHVLSVRVKDALGNWGFTERRSFYIPPSGIVDPPVANIDKMEYYIDNDPGFGLATNISGATGSIVDFPAITVDATTLASGFHTLGIRTRNTDNVWGFDERRVFFIPAGTSTDPPASDMIKMEYFFDTDPGFGAATNLAITTGQLVDINSLIPQSLPSGYHTFFIRARNADNTWGITEGRAVYVKPTVGGSTIPDITKMEYFFDGADPGVGLAIDLPITPAPLIDLNTVDIPTSPALIDGSHYITFRAMNADGVWGMAEIDTFDILDNCTQPIAGFTPQLACAGQTVTFIDTSTSIQLDAQYNWNFDGDEFIDDTTVGDVTFTYPSPGTYIVDLLITQGTICLDSYTTNITIQPQPIAVFSTSGTEVNQPTIFTASATNLPPSVTWQWDFDGDFVVDDTSVGSTSFTYTTEATYNPILVITDGLGCEVTVTNPVIITTGGGGTPSVAFLGENGCTGNIINFSDLSQNLPGGSTYSWDFDGDGTEDSSTPGAQSFTFSATGSYNTNLIIDLGGSTIQATQTIEIVDVPVVDFTTAGTEVNVPTNFTTIVSNAEPTAVWEWDFDANLVVDDNTTGNTNYVYTATGTYNPNLKISNGYGCETTKSNSIVIIDSNNNGNAPSAKFLAENGCVNGTTAFIDLSQNIPVGSTYSWDFNGDGVEDASTTGDQSMSFLTAGTFIAKLTIDMSGSIIEYSQNIVVVEVPIANFSALDVCVGSQMDFTDESTFTNGTSEYSWDFENDGVIDSNLKTNVAFTFATSGSKLVKLIISNGFGCTSEIVKQVNVIAFPVPDFDWNVVCAGEEVSFNDLSSTVESNASYSWDLDGDGIEDFNTIGDVKFTFQSKGIYEASLTISNLSGCETTVTKTIEIIDRPEVDIDIIAKCYGQESQMIDLSKKVSPTATYSWDFENDGSEDDNTTGSTTFTYPTYNTYVVNLTVNNGNGCSSSTEEIVVFSDAAAPDFTINKTCQGEEVVFTDLSTGLETGAVYSWDFNSDGLEDSAFPGSTSYIYNDAGIYTTTLTIDNGGQCLAFKTLDLDVTPPPVVDLGTDLNLCVEGVVTFDAGVGYSAYLWPDGTTNQTFTVDKIGDYMVKVQDAKGCFNSDTITVNLLGPPIPSFDHFIELSLEGIKVHFTNTTTNGDSFLWSFGDGATSNEMNPTYIYSDFSFYETSVYEVCVSSTNACEEAQFCESIFVSPTEFIDEAGDDIKVYPIPVNRLITVELGNHQSETNSLGLVNGQGQVIWRTENELFRHEIDMGNFANGTYFLMLEQKDKFLIKRIIKQ
jgi:PKD repeat protein